LRVVAGAFGEAKGPARIFSPLHVWDVSATAGAVIDLPIATGDNVLVALFAGSVSVEGREIAQAGLLTFDTSGDMISLKAMSDAKLLVLTGTPLGEPIAHYGPFVILNPIFLCRSPSPNIHKRHCPITPFTITVCCSLL
jgi:redox-sensitive bicupin YhaK (pirin superfamily)